jgi:glycosyltransferase involved in cell wall biosynthesis
MKVANIIEEGKVGGPQIRVMRVASAISENVETTVVIPEENSEKYRRLLEIHGVNYKTFPLSRITKELKVLLRYVFFSGYEIYQLYKYFKKNNFDLIHVSGGSWQYKGAIAGKLAKKKVIWHLNDTYMPGLFKLMFKFFSKNADAFIFASERSKKYYESFIHTDKPEFIISAPVDTSLFSLESNIDEICVSDFSKKGKYVVGTVSNINPIKGLDVFIKAAAEINKHVENIEFIIIGPVYKNQNKYFLELKALAENLHVKNITFIGAQDDVRPWLKLFDVYLCTSNAESSPISVWEAMSMSKAIISTDVGDVPKYIKNGVSGEIVPVKDDASIAIKVIELFYDKEKRKLYGGNARKTAKENLTIEVCSKMHLLAYNAVTDSK